MFFLIIFSLCASLGPPASAIAADFEFHEVVPGRAFLFPKDHGKHPDFKTEWWYFTGNLDSTDGPDRWGFQLTFFRRGMMRDVSSALSAWSVRDIYPAHFALSDVSKRRFFYSHLISREGPGLAGADEENLDVRIRDWSAKMEDGVIHLSAREKDYAVSLRLVPEKPLVLHGQGGFSRKSSIEGQASYYYSFTRLKADGTLTFEGRTRHVSGFAWMDHEFGSSVVHNDQVGWDWFSLQLDDGSEIMVSYMRKKSGVAEQPFGTLIEKDGAAEDLSKHVITVSSTGTWTSPHTGAVYPSGWMLEIPARNIRLHIKPAFEDQELASGGSVGVVYWEGAVVVSGTREGRTVHGRGYAELTGYAGSLGGVL